MDGTDITTAHVRQAGPADEAGILDLCWLAHGEMAGASSLSRSKVEHLVRSALAGGGVIGVIEDRTGTISAMIGLTTGSPWFSDDVWLHDFLVFVRADFRRLDTFGALLTFAKAQADRFGLPLQVGFMCEARSEAKSRLYRRHVHKFGEYFRYIPPQRNA